MTLVILLMIFGGLFQPAFAYDGTTTFDSILVAHPSPTFCPPNEHYADHDWQPDGSYIACCNNWLGTATLTSGRGPGGTSVYACCKSGYTCIAPVSVMKDWSIDADGDIHLTDLPEPPLPAIVPATTTPAPTPPSTPTPRQGTGPVTSTGTISRPGATPIATSAGVVVYLYNDNNNNNNNNNNNTLINEGGGESDGLSGGAIAGITVAATVVSAIAAVFGVKYARRQARNGTNRDKPDAEAASSVWNKGQPQSPEPVMVKAQVSHGSEGGAYEGWNSQ
ncbi:hypothetical protein QBC35DRAFT_219630 [Podospora australis]|uniref:Uncharacterized protein n=1 Tax=Podospora australis TaxID=1536484 RepID=A0AAN6WU98_9PEZI|nr:hypothetical protein QBC35DRAFT_219630 [Podospora australis]